MAAAEKNLRRALPGLKRIVPAGDFRRGCELVCDLSLVAEDAKLKDSPELVKTNQLSVYLTDPEHFGSSLLLATGSDAHLQQLRTLAEGQGLSLTDRGLRRGDKSIAAKTEAGIYKALGLQYIEPELREGRGEIALARKHHRGLSCDILASQRCNKIPCAAPKRMLHTTSTIERSADRSHAAGHPARASIPRAPQAPGVLVPGAGAVRGIQAPGTYRQGDGVPRPFDHGVLPREFPLPGRRRSERRGTLERSTILRLTQKEVAHGSCLGALCIRENRHTRRTDIEDYTAQISFPSVSAGVGAQKDALRA